MPNDSASNTSRKAITSLVLDLARPYRASLMIVLAAMAVETVAGLAGPWPLKIVIDNVLYHRTMPRLASLGHWLTASGFSKMHILYGCCAATLIIALSTGLLTHYFTLSMGEIAHRFVHALRCRVFAHVQRLSLRFHDSQRTGDLTSRIVPDVQAIQDVLANGVIIFVSNSCLLVGMLATMLWLNWQFALLALSVAPILFLAIYRSTHRVRSAARAAKVSDGLLASLTQETLASIRIVQGLSQEHRQDERFQKQGTSSLEAHLRGVRYQARITPLIDLLAGVGLALVMWYGATRVMAGVLTTGDLVVFFAYVTNLYSPMRALSRLSYSYSKATAAAERIAELMSVHKEVHDRPGARSCGRLEGRIEFRDVSFGYDPKQPVLTGVNLRIAPGERIAIVGATGAGKSTLISLIPRLFDPTAGTVLIDGEDIRAFSLDSLRDNTSVLLQDTLLFHGTVRDNIAFGRSSASQEEIVAAARVAFADEFIENLPAGYDTLVGERGATLSGGQKQRLAIARAILRDAPIFLMDEPTTGLDAASERLVMRALERASAGRTTVFVTHRLVTHFADRIVVCEHGCVVEDGTHDQLMARGGRYCELVKLHNFAADVGVRMGH